MENKNYKFTFKQITRYMVARILRKDLDNGNTEFLKLAYTKFGLQDNRRILEKAECMKAGDDIQRNLFEFMIDAILDEITENQDDKFLSFFMEYQIRRFPSITKDDEKYNNDPELFARYIKNEPEKDDSIEKSCKLLYNFFYTGNESNMEAIANHYKEGLVSFVDSTYKTNAVEEICQYLGIKDLGSDPSYQKFLTDQRKKLTDFLEIEYRMLERFIADPMGWDPDRNVKEDTDLRLLYTEFALYDILQKHALSTTHTASHDKKEYYNIINGVFESLCNSMLYTACICFDSNERKPASLSELITYTHMEKPQIFITNLFLLSRYELLATTLKKCLNEYYKNFSFDHLEAADREQELTSENTRLRSENEKLQQKLEQQEDDQRKAIQRLSKEGEKETHEYMEQIRCLKRQLEAAQKSNYSQDQSSADKTYMHEEYTPLENGQKPVDISLLTGKKILFLGGSPNTVKKLKQRFSNATFKAKNSSVFSNNIDIAVILADHVGHSLTQKFKSSNSTAKIVHCNSTNVDMIIQTMLEAV